MSDSDEISLAPEFASASKQVLAFLRAKVGMGLWMVTRVAGDDWVVLSAEDHAYGVEPGSLFAWSDSLCSSMVRGLGPRVAPAIEDVPAYREARIGELVSIGSYIGVPLFGVGGELFGTLCAVDPAPMAPELVDCLPTVELLGQLLSGILAGELRAEHAERLAIRAKLDRRHDELTGLISRRGWQEALVAEEDRCARHGHPAAVIMIDLDGFRSVNSQDGRAVGDDLLRRAGAAINGAIRAHDIAARIGGDEFAILAPECDTKTVDRLALRIRKTLKASGIRASVGSATRHPTLGLAAALHQADERMHDLRSRNSASRR
jgi:diguanylate cyclase (GGDEF)-like protein